MALRFSARLSQSIRRTFCVQLQLIHKSPTYCTQTSSALLSPSILDPNDTIESNPCLSKNIERHPRSEPVGSVFQMWMGDGFPVNRGDIFHAITRLRKLKLNKRALEQLFDRMLVRAGSLGCFRNRVV
ncbi:Pentatricopeptide repeat-containing protein [Drosera capensis]